MHTRVRLVEGGCFKGVFWRLSEGVVWVWVCWLGNCWCRFGSVAAVAVAMHGGQRHDGDHCARRQFTMCLLGALCNLVRVQPSATACDSAQPATSTLASNVRACVRACERPTPCRTLSHTHAHNFMYLLVQSTAFCEKPAVPHLQGERQDDTWGPPTPPGTARIVPQSPLPPPAAACPQRVAHTVCL